MLLRDVRDLYPDPDTLFVVAVVSDAMRRGVRHFRMDGTPLSKLDEVLDALASDGDVLTDAGGSTEDPRH